MKVKCFGIARDICKSDNIAILDSCGTVGELRLYLNKNFESLRNINSYMIAVNQEYADDDILINSADEIAIIPPVSGG